MPPSCCKYSTQMSAGKGIGGVIEILENYKSKKHKQGKRKGERFVVIGESGSGSSWRTEEVDESGANKKSIKCIIKAEEDRMWRWVLPDDDGMPSESPSAIKRPRQW
eukprot:gnl/MRDRNA2_/MRDRNA2_76558_c0_seq1.p1 gnl/MRDRNA2_/MRDRNA2_76558_c0~~gnl/MRDRNA2_/MRDRNA2_76558_c0_seq1.p1  ORF type:complete len:107 (+),score=19.27 gnl/MRDRNA2_/MRDRNA2_76558_c0_seq1:377-697(+)